MELPRCVASVFPWQPRAGIGQRALAAMPRAPIPSWIFPMPKAAPEAASAGLNTHRISKKLSRLQSTAQTGAN